MINVFIQKKIRNCSFFNVCKGMSEETIAKHKSSKKVLLVELDLELVVSNFCFDNLFLSADRCAAKI